MVGSFQEADHSSVLPQNFERIDCLRRVILVFYTRLSDWSEKKHATKELDDRNGD